MQGRENNKEKLEEKKKMKENKNIAKSHILFYLLLENKFYLFCPSYLVHVIKCSMFQKIKA